MIFETMIASSSSPEERLSELAAMIFPRPLSLRTFLMLAMAALALLGGWSVFRAT
jgi:hypothetical protein